MATKGSGGDTTTTDVTLVNDDESEKAHTFVDNKIEQKEKTLATKGSGGDTVDVTLVNDDGLEKAHKFVNEKKEQKEKTFTTKGSGGNYNNVTLVNDYEVKKTHNNVDKKVGENNTANVTSVNEDEGKTALKEELFLQPVRTPDKKEKRKMLAKSIEVMIVATLENHVYQFGNVVRRQKEGGPIGLSLTWEIADCYMINWDIIFLEKQKSLVRNLILYL